MPKALKNTIEMDNTKKQKILKIVTGQDAGKRYQKILEDFFVNECGSVEKATDIISTWVDCMTPDEIAQSLYEYLIVQ